MNLLQPARAWLRRHRTRGPVGRFIVIMLVGAALIQSSSLSAAEAKQVKLLNVSYDVTREFYQDFNAAFTKHWREKTGQNVVVNQSHGGSSKQARSVIDGLAADVVTMNQALDIEMLHERGKLIPADWAKRLPNQSVPYTSTILFLVRKGNPKAIKDWEDLVKPGVSVIIPNPKTSGNGRYSYLAAWGYASQGSGSADARTFVENLFSHVPILDAGGRAATTTFAQRGIGDVLLTFENEVALTLQELGSDQLEVVVPSVSVLAENPVVWVDKVVAKHGTEQLARAYLEYLYSDAGQEIAAKHHFRPQSEAIISKYRDRFKPIRLLTVQEIAGGWKQAQQVHFSEGGVFDQLYRKRR